VTTVTPVVGLTTRPATGTNWQAYALCREVDADLFFPEVGTPSRDAKETCFACEVRAECLAYALDNNERVGIWGGLNEGERRRLRKELPAPEPKPEPVIVRPAPPRPEHRGGLPLAPCGTETAYRRHKRNKEPIDDVCAAGHEEWLDDSRERRRKNRKLSRARARERSGYVPKPPPPCGTNAAAYRHKRRGEPLDEACRAAYNAANREQDRKRRAARRQAA
jgi:WhiB family redox-sensing transcriptional regulator